MMDEVLKFLLGLYEGAKALFYEDSKVICHKSTNDILSEADLRLNQYFCSVINAEYPEALLIAEENGAAELTDALTFVIDPLDGTCNYSLGLRLCGMQIAVFKGGECMLSLIGLPGFDEVFYAIKGKGAFMNGQRLTANTDIGAADGILGLSDFYAENDRLDFDSQFLLVKSLRQKFLKTRLFGAACIDFTFLAKSNMQAYICYYRHIWDIAPGLLLIEEAGLVYSGVNKDYSYGDHALIAANSPETLELITGEISKLT